MPRRTASAMAVRLASGNCHLLSSKVPSISSAMRRTPIPYCTVDFGPFLLKKIARYTPKWPFRASTFHALRHRFVSKHPMLNFPFMATHRIYYDDSFEKNFEARVLSCEPGVAPKTDSGMREVWDVVLDRTAFYPTSGGQP